jgi:hypothetical protein
MIIAPCAGLAEGERVYAAGNFWPDVDAVEQGRAPRLWLAFYAREAGGKDESALPADTPFDEIRAELVNLYANQAAQLQPDTIEEDLEIYLVDARFDQAIPLSGFNGTLDELWAAASGESIGEGVDRTFANRVNPLGVTRLAMTDYVARIAKVTNSKVSQSDIEDTARDWLENLAYQDEPLTGFILLTAPKDQTEPPRELEIRTALDASSSSKKKPAGHASQSIDGIAASPSMITQARIKSGVFVDLRLYNGNTQLSFKQSAGRCDAGRCLDLMVYGTPGTLKNLRLGVSIAAREKLTSLGIDEIHIRICTPGDVKPYAEYWLAVDLAG